MKSTKTSATWSSEDREAKTGLKGTRRIAPIGGPSLQINEFQRQVKFKVRLVVRVAALSYEGSIKVKVPTEPRATHGRCLILIIGLSYCDFFVYFIRIPVVI